MTYCNTIHHVKSVETDSFQIIYKWEIDEK